MGALTTEAISHGEISVSHEDKSTVSDSVARQTEVRSSTPAKSEISEASTGFTTDSPVSEVNTWLSAESQEADGGVTTELHTTIHREYEETTVVVRGTSWHQDAAKQQETSDSSPATIAASSVQVAGDHETRTTVEDSVSNRSISEQRSSSTATRTLVTERTTEFSSTHAESANHTVEMATTSTPSTSRRTPHAVTSETATRPFSLTDALRTRQPTYAGSRETSQGSAAATAALTTLETMKTQEEATKTGSMAGIAAGVTAGVIVLILVALVVLYIFRIKRRKSHDLADQDLKDYRKLMKADKRGQESVGVASPSLGFSASPFGTIQTENVSGNGFSMTNYGMGCPSDSGDDIEMVGAAANKGSSKEASIEDLHVAADSGYSVNTFRPRNPDKNKPDIDRPNGNHQPEASHPEGDGQNKTDEVTDKSKPDTASPKGNHQPETDHPDGVGQNKTDEVQE